MAAHQETVALSKRAGNLARFSFPSAMRKRPLLIASQTFVLGNVGHNRQDPVGIGRRQPRFFSLTFFTFFGRVRIYCN
jgi:hypothetical protein